MVRRGLTIPFRPARSIFRQEEYLAPPEAIKCFMKMQEKLFGLWYFDNIMDYIKGAAIMEKSPNPLDSGCMVFLLQV